MELVCGLFLCLFLCQTKGTKESVGKIEVQWGGVEKDVEEEERDVKREKERKRVGDRLKPKVLVGASQKSHQYTSRKDRGTI